MTRKAKLPYYLLPILTVAAFFAGLMFQLELDYTTVDWDSHRGEMIGAKSENTFTVLISDPRTRYEHRTLDLYIPPEVRARCEIDPTPGSRFCGVLTKYMRLNGHLEPMGVWIGGQEAWSWSVPKRIECYFLFALSKFY